MSSFPSINQIMECFFTAMLRGWAADVQPLQADNMRCYRVLHVHDGDWQLEDRWCVRTGSRYSAGTTTILYMNEPVWIMQYAGVYPKAVLPLVKHCVQEAYSRGVFWGGRGQRRFVDEGRGCRYENHPVTNDFTDFQGREEIIDLRSSEVLGWHDYRGMALL